MNYDTNIESTYRPKKKKKLIGGIRHTTISLRHYSPYPNFIYAKSPFLQTQNNKGKYGIFNHPKYKNQHWTESSFHKQGIGLGKVWFPLNIIAVNDKENENRYFLSLLSFTKRSRFALLAPQIAYIHHLGDYLRIM